ncbi:O-methyltransferase [Bifidobacterium xylocopae]|nr:methyltransferase [Bifidobacterium xylocopae]
MNRTSYTNHAKAWQYAEACELNAEPDYLQAVRKQAVQAGFTQGSVAQGAFLKIVAQASHARSIILVGTGSVVEALRLIDGLGEEGQFTAVDSSPQGADLIRRAFRSADIGHGVRLRAVNVRARTYFPRLNPRDYDLIVVAGDESNYRDAMAEAPRLLQANGQIIFTDIMCYQEDEEAGGVMNAANRSPRAVLLRQLVEDCQQTQGVDFDSCLLPIGSGVLLASKR